MGEISGNRLDRPIETVTTELSDTTVQSDGDGTGRMDEVGPVSHEAMYLAIKKMHIMAAGLRVTAARSGDGMYDQYAQTALTAAGLLRHLLEERGSQYAEVLREEGTTELNKPAV